MRVTHAIFFLPRKTFKTPFEEKLPSRYPESKEAIVKNQNWTANSEDSNETAHYEPSHQDLHCLQKLFWSAGLKGLNNKATSDV